ncbi:MAG TPA: sigma-54 dependent transcriptional regulator [Ohtaekwangia sp.]|nr:sigma-54 dependent transcriptional regulator [Ohtaekwangia sp.]
MTPAKILIIDDDPDVLQSARMFLKQEFATVTIEENPKRLVDDIPVRDYDAILLDMNFGNGVNDGEEGFRWLEHIRTVDPDAVVILITAYGEVDLAVRAMKKGAVDFITKPWKNQKLLGTIHAALQLRDSRRQVEKLRQTQRALTGEIDGQFSEFVGTSPAIRRVHELIDRVAETDADVLILGENGTGKEVVARAVHRKSLRKNNVFMSVDLGALTESLFESELFGYVKGAFTDARQDKAGRIEAADGGTLFLDEIGNLSLSLQAKLLTVLQQRRITRLGATKETPVDFRLICATNMDLHDMVVRKTFRQDLLYRINTVEIRVPPLRERPEDIGPLVEYFLNRYAQKYRRTGLRLEKSLITKLRKYSWPGNIRELQHAVERAVILNEGKLISSAELFIHGGHQPRNSVTEPRTMDEMEKQFIRESLNQHDGNVTNTARTLGMTRTALYRRMKKHGL